MDALEKLEDLEEKTMGLVSQTGEMMKLLGLELKQQQSRHEIQDLLVSIVEKIQSINEDLHDTIESLP